MTAEVIGRLLPPQAFGSGRNVKGLESGFGQNARGVVPASQKTEAVTRIKLLDPVPLQTQSLLNPSTSFSTTEIVSDEVLGSDGLADDGDSNEIEVLDVAPGNSGNTPAALARQAIQDNGELASLPFGRVVSQIARGLPVEDLLAATIEEETQEEEGTAALEEVAVEDQSDDIVSTQPVNIATSEVQSNEFPNALEEEANTLLAYSLLQSAKENLLANELTNLS